MNLPKTVVLAASLLLLVACHRKPDAGAIGVRGSPPNGAKLDAYLDLAIDVAEGFGASPSLISKLKSYRGNAQKLLDALQLNL